MALGRDLRGAVFGKVETFAAREVAQFGAPTLITRSTNDVQQVQMLAFMTFTFMIAAPIMCVGGIILALRQDVTLSTLIVIVVPTLAVSIGVVVVKMRPLFRLMQQRIDNINRIMREQIMGIRVIRAFVKEDYERERFAVANHDNMDAAIRVGSADRADLPDRHPRDERVSGRGHLVGRLPDRRRRVAGRHPDGVPELSHPDPDVGDDGDVHVHAVPSSGGVGRAHHRGARHRAERDAACRRRARASSSAAWSDRRVPASPIPEQRSRSCCDIELLASPGQTTAIIGSTGSGKSTLLNLIPRLFDATSGAVRLDGVDVRDMQPDDVWAAIGLIPQRPYLFTGTIASNLRYGNPEATDEDLWDALEVAQGRDFVEAMPEGLDAPVSQGGTNFSGGQRQRLAIARAIVKRPRIYLFDDSFSALDFATDAALRAALRPVTLDATVVIVAQRVSTIRYAERIIVLDEGRVVGTGTHDELMAASPVYREIVLSQLTEEEAA